MSITVASPRRSAHGARREGAPPNGIRRVIASAFHDLRRTMFAEQDRVLGGVFAVGVAINGRYGGHEATDMQHYPSDRTDSAV